MFRLKLAVVGFILSAPLFAGCDNRSYSAFDEYLLEEQQRVKELADKYNNIQKMPQHTLDWFEKDSKSVKNALKTSSEIYKDDTTEEVLEDMHKAKN